MEKFLAATEEDLQKNFDQACTFPKLSSITHNYIEDSIARVAILHALASEVCFKDRMIPSVTRGSLYLTSVYAELLSYTCPKICLLYCNSTASTHDLSFDITVSKCSNMKQ